MCSPHSKYKLCANQDQSALKVLASFPVSQFLLFAFFIALIMYFIIMMIIIILTVLFGEGQ